MYDQSRSTYQSEGPTTAGRGGVAVVDLWTFSVQPSLPEMDPTDFSVEATDGQIGKIDEATSTYEAEGSYLIVDTGPWIFGKKFMLPAGVVESVDTDEKKVFVDRSKDEIKNAPEYDEKAHRGDLDYRRRLGSYYS